MEKLSSLLNKLALRTPFSQWIALGLVTLLCAAGLRLFQLTTIPAGLTWDEAAIGYNGWSVWQTKRDEWLQLAPISFRSFGDYKAPVAIYLVGIFTHVFGLNTLAVRLPFALTAIVACAAMGWLAFEWRAAHDFFSSRRSYLNTVREQTKQSLHQFSVSKYAGFIVLAISLITFSPWHLHFSRAGFESGLALFFVILGLGTWYRGIRKSAFFWFMCSVLFFGISLYTYHSAKIAVPLIGMVLLLQASRVFFANRKQFLLWGIIGSLFGILLLFPLVFDSLYRGGATRFTQTSVISTNLPFVTKISTIGSNFFSHFTLDFLVLGKVTNYRQGIGEWGVLLPIPFLLLLIWGFVTINTGITSAKNGFKDFKNIAHSSKLIPVALICIGFIPSSLGIDEVPHTIRSLLALPGFILLIVAISEDFIQIGRNSKINQTILGSHGEKNIIIKSLLGTLVLFHAITVIAMISVYFTSFQIKSSDAFISQYVPAMKMAHEFALGEGRPKKDKVIVSSAYGQPYIFTLFANKISPYAYHNGILINYEFKQLDMGDFQRPNAVIFATELDEEFLAARADYVLYGPDNSEQFKVFITK